MRNKIIASAFLAALALGAKAAVITQEESFSADGGWAQDLNFNQFDPSLGTLNSVTLDLAGNGRLATSVDNNSLGGLTFGITGDYTFDAYIPGGPLTLTKELIQNFYVGLGATAGQTTSGTVTGSATLSGDLSAWEGLGSVALPADAGSSISYATVAGNTVDATGTAGVDATITYDYTALPEGPLPWWSAASGLLGVFLLAAKKKAGGRARALGN